MSLLRKINLFPYNNWWRLGGESHLKNQCGGVSTLLIFLVVGAIFVYTLRQVFSRTKMTITQTISRENFADNFNITTFQNDSTMSPFMMAINIIPGYLTGQQGILDINDFDAKGHITSFNTTVNQYVYSLFELQSCTANHFSKVPYIAEKFDDLGFKSWLCLPINKTYTFGGDYAFLNNTDLFISIYCKTERCHAENNTKIFTHYILKAEPNLQNKQSPISYYLERRNIYFSHNTYTRIDFSLQLNNITTDNALFPLQSDISSLNAYSLNNFVQTVSMPTLYSAISIFIKRSPNTYVYQRSYQKLLDTISYIGGIFQSIFALFLFMQLFNTSYFEMKLGTAYFRRKQTKNYFFGSFLKQGMYEMLYKTKLKPNWEKAETRKKIEQAVRSLQDIIYVNRRIEFLEKAINVLLQKHQLKALRLLHNNDESQVIRDYKKQKFRDRVIYLLKRNKIIKSQDQSDKKKKKNGQLYRKRSMNQRRSPRMKEEEQTKKEIKRGLSIDLQRKLSFNASPNKADGLFTSQNLIRDVQIRQFNSLNPQVNQSKMLDQEIDQEELAEYNNIECDNQLIVDIEDDIKKLFTEAEKATADKRSKRIYELIDNPLREKLRIAIDHFEVKQIIQLSTRDELPPQSNP